MKEILFILLRWLIYIGLFVIYWCISGGIYFSWYKMEYGINPKITNLPFSVNIIIPITLVILSVKFYNSKIKKKK